MKKSVLIVTNLTHSIPRLPALFSHLSDTFDITIIDYRFKDGDQQPISIEGCKIKQVICPYDLLTPLRKVLLKGQSSYSGGLDSMKGKTTLRSQIFGFIFKAFQTFFAVPDNNWPAYWTVKRAINEELAKNHFDIVFTSSPYNIVHFFGAYVSKVTSAFWVADFRDGWSTNHNYPFFSFRQPLDRWLEKRTLSRANVILGVNSYMSEKLKLLHGRDISCIYNGFSNTIYQPSFETHEKLTILYSGRIYSGQQNLRKFLVGLKQFIVSETILSSDLEFRYVGPNYQEVNAEISKLSLSQYTVSMPSISPDEVRKMQSAADLLLLLGWEDDSEEEIYPLKFYEYLSSGKQIILSGGASSSLKLADILGKTRCGNFAADSNQVAERLSSAYKEFKNHGYLHCEPDRAVTQKFSYAHQAKRLSSLFTGL